MRLTAASQVATKSVDARLSRLLSSAHCSIRASRRILDRKSTRLNSSHANIYPLSLHDPLPIYATDGRFAGRNKIRGRETFPFTFVCPLFHSRQPQNSRSEEHTSELQSRQYLPSFPTRPSSDLCD